MASARPSSPAGDCGPCRPTDPALVAGERPQVSIWQRLRPLAFLAPLAVNWPGGKMAL